MAPPRKQRKPNDFSVAGVVENSRSLRKTVASRTQPTESSSAFTSVTGSGSQLDSSGSSQFTSTSLPAESRNAFLSQILSSRTNWGSAQLFPFRMERVRQLTVVKSSQKLAADQCVLYWMSRDCRVQDNWAFIYAQKMALESKVPLLVVYCLVPKFGDASLRMYKFLLYGAQEVSAECEQLNIPFYLLTGLASAVLPDFVRENKVGLVICDFSPLRVPLQWIQDVKQKMAGVPFVQVDAHNIVPCWVASDKEEVGARTLRGKIHKHRGQFLTAFPPVIKHPYLWLQNVPNIDWVAAEQGLEVDRSVDAVDWAKPGTSNGLLVLHQFLTSRLSEYEKRNDPNVAALSNLSPWFHFGQISVARAILEAERMLQGNKALKPGFEVFFEEAVVRRELSDNFCFYNKNYDNLDGAKAWARLSLDSHSTDARPVIYSLKDLEEGRTADDLWNAAQMQMVHEGKMHGFLRMYWAKKILEWTETPADALKFAILLNDKYSIDGRDPNGYVGCMWSICGIHDMGWKEREVFGKIRYMNYAGCKRKFDVDAFVDGYRQYFIPPQKHPLNTVPY